MGLDWEDGRREALLECLDAWRTEVKYSTGHGMRADVIECRGETMRLSKFEQRYGSSVWRRALGTAPG